MTSEGNPVIKRAREDGPTCEQFIAALVEYLGRELPAAERERMDLHLEVCPDCVRYLESYDVTIKLGKRALADDADETELPDDFVNIVVSATRKPS